MERIVFCLCVFTLFFSLKTSEGYKDGLYSTEDDDVLPLNTTSLMQRVIKNKGTVFWTVEFYNSWCGHCIHFAPTWKKLASSLKGWRDLMLVAAIDCSQAVNLDVCRKFDIQIYPTMKMFSPRMMNNGTGKPKMREIKTQDTDLIIHHMLNFMTEFTPPSWPRIKPLLEIEDIWKEKTDAHKYVALVFETPRSTVGRKVILDMRHTPNLLVRTMVKESVTKNGIKEFPSLYELHAPGNLSLLAIGNKVSSEDHPLFVNILQKLSKGEGHQLNIAVAKKKLEISFKPKVDASEKEETVLTMNIPAQNNSFRVTMQDLESALHYGFRQEIAICKSIGGDKFKALQDFVDVLLKYFPGRQPIMKFLHAVSQMLSHLPTSILSGEEWMTKLDSLESSEAFIPDVIEWDCCKGSQPRYRGYPCAMWTLFHVLTVGAFKQHRLSGRDATSPLEVPLAIRGYMKHFFGCETCSKHFVQMVANMEKEIDSIKGTVLWLWSSHNQVNKRLKGEESEDKVFPKTQFPPVTLCPKCLRENGNSTEASPDWNMESVLEFLVSFYEDKNIYVNPKLSQFKFSDMKTSKEATGQKQPENSVTGELDWWETKQQEKDLKTIKLFKARNRNNKTTDDERSVEGESGKEFGIERITSKMSKQHEETMFLRNGHLGGILSDLDISMCVVFYILSTVIILILYYHFIVRRSRVPCKGICFR